MTFGGDLEITLAYLGLDGSGKTLPKCFNVFLGMQDLSRTSVRTRLIELFELFDPADPDVIAGRRNLANALY